MYRNDFELRPIKYEKNGIVSIDSKNYSLIDFLSLKRKENKITKKAISNIIKKNDYWYSQIEMKSDDSRRKYINRDDLVAIISVIIFNARNETDLMHFRINSINYIDNVINAVPCESKTTIPLVESEKKYFKIYNEEFAKKQFDDTMSELTNTFKRIYFSSSTTPYKQNSMIHILNEIILNLNTEPDVSLHYYGLPFSSFFAARQLSENNTIDLDKEKFNDLNELLKKYSSLITKDDFNTTISRLIHVLKHALVMYNNDSPVASLLASIDQPKNEN